MCKSSAGENSHSKALDQIEALQEERDFLKAKAKWDGQHSFVSWTNTQKENIKNKQTVEIIRRLKGKKRKHRPKNETQFSKHSFFS